jgi:hypothetical protein
MSCLLTLGEDYLMNKTWIHAVGFVMAMGASIAYAPGARAETEQEYVALWDSTWATYLAEEAIPLPERGVDVESASISIVINAPVDDVYAVYSNVYNAVGINPDLDSVVPIHYTFAGGIPTFDFIAVESIPLGGGVVLQEDTVAQYRFHDDEHFYDADSYDVPGIITHQHVVFVAIDCAHTQVTEYLTFEAPPIYIAETAEGGVFAHEQIQAGFKAAIESGTLKETLLDDLIEGDFFGF